MKQAEQRANELYPNDRAFCGGVASIARDAYLKGCQETLDMTIKALKVFHTFDTFEQACLYAENIRKKMEENWL